MSVWNHIEKNEAYQSLDDAGKAKIRRDYFNEFMVSDPDFGKLPEPERERVYMEFVNQGQQPLEQVPKTPISDFVSAQDKLAGQAVGAMEKIGMPTTTTAAGPAPPLPPQLAPSHEVPPPQVSPFDYPNQLQATHQPQPPEPFSLPNVNIPESIEPVLDMDPNLIRPYEARQGEEVSRELLKMIGALSGGLGYLAGATEIGPQTKGMGLEERSARGQEMAATASEPFMRAEQAIATTPETGLDIAFRKLMEYGDETGAMALKDTGNPYWAAAVATSIQALPLLLPLAFRSPRAIGVAKKIKSSKLYQKMGPAEKAKIFETLDETIRNNPNFTEGQILRKFPQFKEEALGRRGAELTPEAPRQIEAPERFRPQEPHKISDFYIRKNDLAGGIEKLQTLKKRYAENGIDSEIPKVDKAIAAIEDVVNRAPAASQAQPPEAPAKTAAPEPARVPPFPEQKPALPAPLEKPQPIPLPEAKSPEISQMAEPVLEQTPEIEPKAVKPEIPAPEAKPIPEQIKPSQPPQMEPEAQEIKPAEPEPVEIKQPEVKKPITSNEKAMMESAIIDEIKSMEKSGIDYIQEIEIEETGQVVKAKKDASQRLREIDDEIDAYQKLLDCIGKLGK